MAQKEKPFRSRAYLSWVKQFPCLICNRPADDPHHLRHAERSGMGRKVSDKWVVPLCRGCHDQCHREGKESLFWAMQGVDAIAWAVLHHAKWLTQQSGEQYE